MYDELDPDGRSITFPVAWYRRSDLRCVALIDEVIEDALSGQLFKGRLPDGAPTRDEGGPLGVDHRTPSTAPGPQNTRGSPWNSVRGAWEFDRATPFTHDDGSLRFEIQWLPVWIFEKGIRRLGPQARKTLERLQAKSPVPPSRHPDDLDDGWTEIPNSYRLPRDCSWDAPVAKIRQVNGLVQGLVQWPASVVGWADFTEANRETLRKELVETVGWKELFRREELTLPCHAPERGDPTPTTRAVSGVITRLISTRTETIPSCPIRQPAPRGKRVTAGRTHRSHKMTLRSQHMGRHNRLGEH